MYSFPAFHRQYLERVVLDLPALNLEPARRYALLGENGAGKTTLLAMLTERFQAQLPPWQVGYLPQKPYPFALKVRDSLAIGIPPQLALSAEQRDSLIESQLEAFDLQALAHKRADRLSGGESQRLAIARLLMVPREVLLLDEPSNHIDRDRQTKIHQLLDAYIARNKCLVVITSHQALEAEQLADDVLLLEQGQLIFSGSVAEFRRHKLA